MVMVNPLYGLAPCGKQGAFFYQNSIENVMMGAIRPKIIDIIMIIVNLTDGFSGFFPRIASKIRHNTDKNANHTAVKMTAKIIYVTAKVLIRNISIH